MDKRPENGGKSQECQNEARVLGGSETMEQGQECQSGRLELSE